MSEQFNVSGTNAEYIYNQYAQTQENAGTEEAAEQASVFEEAVQDWWSDDDKSTAPKDRDKENTTQFSQFVAGKLGIDDLQNDPAYQAILNATNAVAGLDGDFLLDHGELTDSLNSQFNQPATIAEAASANDKPADTFAQIPNININGVNEFFDAGNTLDIQNADAFIQASGMSREDVTALFNTLGDVEISSADDFVKAIELLPPREAATAEAASANDKPADTFAQIPNININGVNEFFDAGNTLDIQNADAFIQASGMSREDVTALFNTLGDVEISSADDFVKAIELLPPREAATVTGETLASEAPSTTASDFVAPAQDATTTTQDATSTYNGTDAASSSAQGETKTSIAAYDENADGHQTLDMTTGYIYNHDGNGASRSYDEVREALAGDIAAMLGFVDESADSAAKIQAGKDHADEIEELCKGILETNGRQYSGNALDAILKIGNNGIGGSDDILKFNVVKETIAAQQPAEPEAQDGEQPEGSEPVSELASAQDKLTAAVANPDTANVNDIKAAVEELESTINAEIEANYDLQDQRFITGEDGKMYIQYGGEDGPTVELVDGKPDPFTYSALDPATKDAIQTANTIREEREARVAETTKQATAAVQEYIASQDGGNKQKALDTINADINARIANGAVLVPDGDYEYRYDENNNLIGAVGNYNDGTHVEYICQDGKFEIVPEKYQPGGEEIKPASLSPKTEAPAPAVEPKTVEQTYAEFQNAKNNYALAKHYGVEGEALDNAYNQYQAAAEADVATRGNYTITSREDGIIEHRTYEDGTKATYIKQQDGSWKLDASTYNPVNPNKASEAKTDTLVEVDNKITSIGVDFDTLVKNVQQDITCLSQYNLDNLLDNEFEELLNSLSAKELEYIYNNVPLSKDKNSILQKLVLVDED